MSSAEQSESLTKLAGRTVIITGGAGGIGAATAWIFNSNGANVVIADIPTSEATANELISSFLHPENAIFVAVNILNWKEMLHLFQETIERFGSIDTVVANAGIMEKTETLDIDSVDEQGNLLESGGAFNVIDVNVKGTLNTLRLALHYMKRPPTQPSNTRKSIVLVASTSGYFGGTGVSAYVSSKHAIIGLLRSSHARAAKYGVTVTAVAPFFTYTNITARAGKQWQADGLRPNSTEDVGAAIALASVQGEGGSCTLVAGPHRNEMEGSRTAVMPQWIGQDVVDFFGTAFRIISSSGGYNLSKAGSKI